MDKWWVSVDSEHPRPEQRDYYRLTDGDGRALWAFKDTVGKWYVHGVFA